MTERRITNYQLPIEGRRVRLVLEYDGTDFHGFQKQPGLRTVQREIEERLSAVCGHRVAVMAAGRTDAGVHATGQVVHFDTTGKIPVERVARAVNSLGRQPWELRIRAAEGAPEGFHARFSALRRTYHYYVSPEPPAPFAARYVAYVPGLAADGVDRMRAALPVLLGEHDFGAFCAAGMRTANTVRTMHAATLARVGPLLRLELTANAFLHSMVRAIAGTLLEIGKGRREPEALREALEARDRSAAGPTAPARGLFLARVEYPDGYPVERELTIDNCQLPPIVNFGVTDEDLHGKA